MSPQIIALKSDIDIAIEQWASVRLVSETTIALKSDTALSVFFVERFFWALKKTLRALLVDWCDQGEGVTGLTGLSKQGEDGEEEEGEDVTITKQTDKER